MNITTGLKRKKTGAQLLFSPVHEPLLLGVMYKLGEIIPHARIKPLIDKGDLLAGLAFKGEETLYFVASHENVIEHIRKHGCVPLSQTQHLHIFTDKKRFNAHLSAVA